MRSASPKHCSSRSCPGRSRSASAGPAPTSWDAFAARPGGLREFEEAALAAAAEGRLTPVVAATFPLADAAAAHSALEDRATTGKVVLIP